MKVTVRLKFRSKCQTAISFVCQTVITDRIHRSPPTRSASKDWSGDDVDPDSTRYDTLETSSDKRLGLKPSMD